MGDGNATLVGEWVKMPGITKHLKCIGTMRSTVTDKGRPVLLGNMSFTWRAPTIDFGPITFVLSVVKGNRYTEVSSPSISFNTFPVSSQFLLHFFSPLLSISSHPSSVFLLTPTPH